MKVTDLEYSMDSALLGKLNLMIKRCEQVNPKRDALLIVEGGEGEGKTTFSCEIAYYISYVTGRNFGNENIFFRAGELLKFAQNTEKQIIIYDEPALDMLSNEWWKKEQRDLIKLLMMARKKRHFFIFNLTKFNKFSEYIVVDRALGMLHVYSRNEIESGRFVYIKKKSLEYLYNAYRVSKKRLYKKYTTFHGTFPDVLDKIIDVDRYEKEKDKAIMAVGEIEPTRKLTRNEKSYNKLRWRIANMVLPGITQKMLCEKLSIDPRNFREWKKIDPEATEREEDGDVQEYITNNGSRATKKIASLSDEGEQND